MRKILALLALAATSATAQNLNVEDARQCAADFFKAQNATLGPNHIATKIDPVLAYTASTAGQSDFFVFNRATDTNGFVIVNARNNGDALILGYSENATFDYDAIPDNFRWWLTQYQTFGTAPSAAAAPATRATIAPLTKTKWNQDTPFNSVIPKANGKSVMTGCTATAMAQVMKVFEWPTTGVGSKSYSVDVKNGNNSYIATVNFSANFGATTYDWKNMPDVWDGSWTDAQKKAVSTLIYHCGVAEESTYGTDGTAAIVLEDAKALINNFRYDKSIRYADRKYYSNSAWEDLVYSELAAGRPILYSGNAGANIGHSFICDGYSADKQMFSFNWGWGGYCDGYYALTGTGALRPDGSGIGGSGSGSAYTQSQTIVYNIKPDEGGNYATLISMVMADMYDFSSISGFVPGAITDQYYGSASYNYSVNVAGGNKNLYYMGTPWNIGFAPVALDFGVMLRNTSTGETYTALSEHIDELGQTAFGVNYFKFNTSIVPADGVYEVLGAIRSDASAEWEPVLLDTSYQIPKLTITGRGEGGGGGTDPDPDPDPIVPGEYKGLVLTQDPVVNDDNVVTESSNITINLNFNNTADDDVPLIFYIRVDGDVYRHRIRTGYSNYDLPNGVDEPFSTNISSSLAGDLTPGKYYKIEFFVDEACTIPMNYPSVEFYYTKTADPHITEVTDLVRRVHNGEGSVKHIDALGRKVLKK